MKHSSPVVLTTVYAHMINDTNFESACSIEEMIIGKNGSTKRKRVYGNCRNPLNFMVRQAGFEPAAYGFVVRRSIRAELLAHGKLG